MYYAFLALLVFFFFFNDTATTEIYTLSLHDALPISGAAYRADRPAGAPRHAVRPPRHTARRDPGDLPRGHRDRKSTRLNSSHGYISYAVFCLKKKKTPNTSIDHRRSQRNKLYLQMRP